MSERFRDYEEKRDFIRMNLGSAATLRINGESFPATCVDLSSTGMRLRTRCKVAVDDQVEVEIGSQHSTLSGFKAIATVVRKEPDEGDVFELGLQVQQIL